MPAAAIAQRRRPCAVPAGARNACKSGPRKLACSGPQAPASGGAKASGEGAIRHTAPAARGSPVDRRGRRLTRRRGRAGPHDVRGTSGAPARGGARPRGNRGAPHDGQQPKVRAASGHPLPPQPHASRDEDFHACVGMGWHSLRYASGVTATALAASARGTQPLKAQRAARMCTDSPAGRLCMA